MKHPPKQTPSILERIKGHLHTLKLKKIQDVLDDELNRATQQNLAPSIVIERLFSIEASSLIERRIERKIRESKLPDQKHLIDFDFKFQTGIDKAQIMELASLSFVHNKQGLILAGESGTGKSHLAKALLLIGCQQLFRCRYTTASCMLTDLMAGLSDNTLEDKLKSYTRPDILVIDEVGFDRLEQESSRHATLFFKVIDARYGKATTIMTTNIDFRELGDYLGDPVITTAIVDRLIHHSIIIKIDGPSWRMFQSKKLNQSSKSLKTAPKKTSKKTS